jgi:hypothetical protein
MSHLLIVEDELELVLLDLMRRRKTEGPHE